MALATGSFTYMLIFPPRESIILINFDFKIVYPISTQKNFKTAEFIITRTQYSTKIILMFTNSKILKIKKVKCATDHWRPRSMPIEK